MLLLHECWNPRNRGRILLWNDFLDKIHEIYDGLLRPSPVRLIRFPVSPCSSETVRYVIKEFERRRLLDARRKSVHEIRLLTLVLRRHVEEWCSDPCPFFSVIFASMERGSGI